jgi:type I restriction enzyme S subunit
VKAGWTVRPLGEVVSIIGGGTPPKNNPAYYNGSIPWATVRDMNVEMITATDHSITQAGLTASSSKIIPAGEVVIASRVGLGKVCILGQDTAINQDLRGLVPKSRKALDRRFLYYWYKSAASLVVDAGTGATVQGVTLPFLKALPIPLPPLEEQERIVAILDEALEGLARARAHAEANLQNARELFETVLSIRTNATEFSKKPLNSICDVRDGTHDSPKYVATGIPLVTQKNIRSEGLNLGDVKLISREDHEAIHRRSNVAQGDILISMIGANRGMACIVDCTETISIKNVGLIKSTPNINMDFLLLYLQSADAKNYILDSTNGGAQPFVGLGKLRAFPIPLPERATQDTIAAELIEISSIATSISETYETKLQSLDTLRQSLLQKAFAGELT